MEGAPSSLPHVGIGAFRCFFIMRPCLRCIPFIRQDPPEPQMSFIELGFHLEGVAECFHGTFDLPLRS
jgi:hypothetical protein